MTWKSEIGQYGEDLAVKRLLNNKFRILERNYRQPWGEIDIIARRRDGTLVFVEVKTVINSVGDSENEDGDKMRKTFLSQNRITPEDQLTKAKLAKLCRTAELYAGENPAMVNDQKGWQIDLVAIEIKGEGEPEIRHYENIVE